MFRRLWPARRPPAPVADRAALGRWGEDLAARELERRGYAIRARNVGIGRGEIDLVADHEGAVVFVEVKTRADAQFGGAREAIASAKSERLVRLAREYLARHRQSDAHWRIDVVAIDVEPDGRYQLDVIPNAISG